LYAVIQSVLGKIVNIIKYKDIIKI